jgi:hypothetical protein
MPLGFRHSGNSKRTYKGHKKMLGKAIAIAISVLFIGILVNLGKFVEYNPISDILVVQRLGGQVHVYTDAGYKPQNWGAVTHYKKSSPLDFTASPIKVRFADGGHGDVVGSCRFDLPLDEKKMIDIHQTFGSPEAVEKQLVRTTAERSMYMTGPLMTSTESFNVRRQDLINLFEDQAKLGVYQTIQVPREIEDPATNQKKWITMVELKKDKDGNVLRQETSPLIRFGVTLYNVAITGVTYEKVVEEQISQQQTATIAVQIAIANSKKAEQDVKTVEAQGKAKQAIAKWDQEVIKATAVTKAQQEKEVAETAANRDRVVAETAATRDLNVAKLAKETADNYKARLILEGEGESTKRKLIMAADGALAVKLDAWKIVNGVYAKALGDYHGNLVPQFITGGAGAGAQGNSAIGLVDLLTAKTAKDLSLDLTFQQKGQ